MATRERAVIYLRKSLLRNADNDLEAHLERALATIRNLALPFNPETDVYMESEGHRSGTGDKRRTAFRHMMERVRDKDSNVRYIV